MDDLGVVDVKHEVAIGTLTPEIRVLESMKADDAHAMEALQRELRMRTDDYEALTRNIQHLRDTRKMLTEGGDDSKYDD